MRSFRRLAALTHISQDNRRPISRAVSIPRGRTSVCLADVPSIASDFIARGVDAYDLWDPRIMSWIRCRLDHDIRVNERTRPTFLIRYANVRKLPNFGGIVDQCVWSDRDSSSVIDKGKGVARG